MEISSWIRVDQAIHVSPDLDKENWYSSKILDVQKRSFRISLPVRRQIVLHPQKGQKVRISISTEEGLYLSTCEVLQISDSERSGLEVEIPQKLVHMERRRFMRLPVRLEVYYSEIRERSGDLVYIRSYSVDLSGGGMLLELHRNCPQETLLRMKFILPDSEPQEKFMITGRIVRSVPTGPLENRQAGIEFIDITSREQDAISRFIHGQLQSGGAEPDTP